MSRFPHELEWIINSESGQRLIVFCYDDGGLRVGQIWLGSRWLVLLYSRGLLFLLRFLLCSMDFNRLSRDRIGHKYTNIENELKFIFPHVTRSCYHIPPLPILPLGYRSICSSFVAVGRT